ncbi:shikimate dehydrogenase [Singulisphaera acidiphila]|uniref:Multifunctional fusion protein n=1 Tax=Singulisphaera acidiphila (strain ATCC BAA-1392 / DSM 18658 / VKM B-2454 / MOB10) TaxID=886293 RepID=L0DDK6_SINAD|nr:shikimate dehydrogenase [Singulisphaera acidiphila]AGA26935.1 shikimate 5-dehydrogenase [Singulisphaera acidiphila DSM 18658]
MICVTLGRGRHASLAEEWKEAAAAGVELVELRLDCLRREPDLKRILANRPTPLVFTIRRGVDGGIWRGSEDRRQQLLREAIALGVDYVDLEMDIAPKIRRFGKTKRIVSYHNLKKTPAELIEIAEQCDEMDADVVKIATKAESLADALRVLSLGTRAVVPTVTIAMGELGFFTRVLGAKYKAPFTYAGINPERTFAPGMPTFQVLKNDYAYDMINAETEVYAVIGDPIEQSLSPAIHNAAFRHLGLNKVLVPLLIPAGTLEASLKELEVLNIQGFSVTIPHKEELVKLLDQKDGAVERTGSCNTLVFQKGKKIGHNTDYRAAMDTLEAGMGGLKEGGASPLMDKQVLILGAGGAARSISFGCSRRGASVTITNRHDARATKLAEEVGCRTVSWAQRASTLAEIVVNCTPVGMHPNVDDTPVPPATFSTPGMIAFDTIYHPENTMFLKLARERECIPINGVDMFVGQAAEQFKLYTGMDAPKDIMRAALKRKLGPIRL